MCVLIGSSVAKLEQCIDEKDPLAKTKVALSNCFVLGVRHGIMCIVCLQHSVVSPVPVLQYLKGRGADAHVVAVLMAVAVRGIADAHPLQPTPTGTVRLCDCLHALLHGRVPHVLLCKARTGILLISQQLEQMREHAQKGDMFDGW